MGFPIAIKVERRLETPAWLRTLVPISSLVLALVLASAVFAVQGLSPLAIYKTTFSRVLGTRIGFSFLLLKVIPLLLCAVGLTLAFRAQVWNLSLIHISEPTRPY